MLDNRESEAVRQYKEKLKAELREYYNTANQFADYTDNRELAMLNHVIEHVEGIIDGE